VVVGRESWGAAVAIFIPASEGVEIRQAPLTASGYEAAERELDRMGGAGLQDLLDRSQPKTM
jgi:hypothetical protein